MILRQKDEIKRRKETQNKSTLLSDDDNDIKGMLNIKGILNIKGSHDNDDNDYNFYR